MVKVLKIIKITIYSRNYSFQLKTQALKIISEEIKLK